MTIIAAYRDSDKIWIGSDSYGFSGLSKSDYGSKLISKKNYIIGFAGSYRVKDLIKEEKALPKEINKLDDLRDFRDILKLTLIEEAGASTTGVDNNLVEHPINLLIVSQLGIYLLQDTYQMLKCYDRYGAIGAGEDFALGSLATSDYNKELNGKKAVMLAIKSAIKHCTESAGRIFIKNINIQKGKK